MTTLDLTKKTPTEVDTMLVASEREYAWISHRTEQLAKLLEADKDRLEKYKGYAKHDKSMEDHVVKYQERVDAGAKDIAEKQAELKVLNEKIVAAHDEFSDRGGWTRYWIVTNTNGHVHRNMNCSTCFPTTQYAWLPELAGSDDKKVVELAGCSACTVCFSDAPVEAFNRPSQIEEPDKKKAREEREAKKAERDAKKAAKAISNPDGTPLIMNGWKVVAERTAQIETVGMMVYDAIDARGIYKMPNRGFMEEKRRDLERGLEALAHKRGTTVEEQRELLKPKVEAKIKKEWKR